MVFNRIRFLLLALVTAALTACGGGDTTVGVSVVVPPVKPIPLKAEAFVQPAATVDLPMVKARALASPAPLPAVLVMGPMNQAKLLGLDDGRLRQIGAPRALIGAQTQQALGATLQWSSKPTGAMVAALSVSAEGAHGLRLGLHIDALPGSAAVRVYSQTHPGTVYEISGQQILQTIERNLASLKAGGTGFAGSAGSAGSDSTAGTGAAQGHADADAIAAARIWWTPELGESEQTVEFELPPGTDPRALQVSIPTVSHIYEDLSLPQAGELTTKINESATCNLDATCYEELAQQRNAVARMLFTEQGKSYVCTGTLMNDTGSTSTPYFLSADHCISSQTVASSLQTDWFYRSPSCNARTLSAQSTRRQGGATLLYSSQSTDTTLLRLNQAPPPGAVFSGWDANTVGVAAAVAGLHHPGGDLLKASFGQVVRQADCKASPNGGFGCRSVPGNFYQVQWNSGTTEGGSSGSALFRNGYVVGTLYGGAVTCTPADSRDYYGRFDVAYRAALKNWLVSPSSPAGARVPVYRFFNARTGAHFYTASAGERDFVSRTYPDFRYENVAFYAYAKPTDNQSTVFRFYNPQSGAHFYTISGAERDFVQRTYPVFQYEGAAWYAQTSASGSATPMYRFYNTRTGAHFYTISASERDFVIANYRDFSFEGTAYFAWTTEQ